MYRVTFSSIENPAGRLDYLPESPTFQLRRLRAAIRMSGKLINMFEYSLNPGARRYGVVQRNIVCNSVEIIECWLSPDYSNRSMRCFVLA